MQTYSHFIITAALGRPFKNKAEASEQSPPLRKGAFMLGSIVPDLPLIFTAIGCILYDAVNGLFGTADSTVRMLFRDWFFNNPWVKAPHNLFHSPLLDAGYIFFGYWLWKRGYKSGAWLFWFAIACMIHTLIDIPLHHNDGPLLLFPLNWSWRFMSPVSYWDPDHYGTPFAIFEHSLVLALLIYLLVLYRKGIAAFFRARVRNES